MIFCGVLYAYYGTATEIAIPEGVKTIIGGTFKSGTYNWEKKLDIKSVEIPASVKEIGNYAFANNKKFSSNAAKRDFIKEMTSANLTMQNDVIMGADDFANNYMKNNSDAFVVEQPNEPDNKPSFVMPTVPTPNPGNDNAFIQAFNFTGVRPHDTK